MAEIEPKIFLLENTASSAKTLDLSRVLIRSHTNTKPTKPSPLTISISFITPYDTVYIRGAGVDYFISTGVRFRSAISVNSFIGWNSTLYNK